MSKTFQTNFEFFKLFFFHIVTENLFSFFLQHISSIFSESVLIYGWLWWFLALYVQSSKFSCVQIFNLIKNVWTNILFIICRKTTTLKPLLTKPKERISFFRYLCLVQFVAFYYVVVVYLCDLDIKTVPWIPLMQRPNMNTQLCWFGSKINFFVILSKTTYNLSQQFQIWKKLNFSVTQNEIF